MLDESREAAGNPEMNPFGLEENRRNLEVAIECMHRQRDDPAALRGGGAVPMIVDCHGHYTTAPQALWDWRKRQVVRRGTVSRGRARRSATTRSATASRGAQLKLQRERGTDVTLFSPRAGAMAHHVGDAATSAQWSRVCNDLIHRVCTLYPKNFVAVCQLPQSPGVSPANCVAELERCVNELGFVGCNLNPDPSGGYWKEPPLTDRWWYPIYEKMVELDVPAMVHVSSSCNPAFHSTGAHYINADTTAFMQFIQGDLFKDFPHATLRHPARRRRGALPLGPLPRPGAGHEAAAAAGAPAEERLLRHLRLPPAGHRPAAQGDPGRQHPVRLGDGRRGARHRPGDRPATTTTPSATSTRAALSAADKRKIFEGNARTVYSRWRA